MLGDPDALDAAAVQRREAVRERVEDYNRVLAEVCAEDRRCRDDGGAVYEHRFGTRQLSRWGFFHPSVDGQARLAEPAHRAVTAKEPVTSWSAPERTRRHTTRRTPRAPLAPGAGRGRGPGAVLRRQRAGRRGTGPCWRGGQRG